MSAAQKIDPRAANMPTEAEFKRRAKEIKRKLGIKHSEALNRLSVEYGFRDYHEAHEVMKRSGW